MTNKTPPNRPVSRVVWLGLVITIISIFVPVFVFVRSLPLFDVHAGQAGTVYTLILHYPWRLMSIIGLSITLLGLVRSLYLRHRAALVEQAKVEAGLMGEVQTAAELANLDLRYRVFNRFYLHHRGRTHEFDHVVIGPNGVFHIESKNWAGEIRVSKRGVKRSVKGNIHDPAEQMRRHHTLLCNLLRDHNIQSEVIGVLCFTNKRADVKGSHPSFLVTGLYGLNEVIQRHAAKSRLSAKDIARITALIEQQSSPHRQNE